VLALVVLFTVGVMIPRVLLSDGLAGLPPDVRQIGEEALQFADVGCLGNPIDNLIVTQKLRVVRVEQATGGCPVGSAYRVRIQRHTLFGIPTGTILVCGNRAHCWGLDQW
jgi:hypothetical protein